VTDGGALKVREKLIGLEVGILTENGPKMTWLVCAKATALATSVHNAKPAGAKRRSDCTACLQICTGHAPRTSLAAAPNAPPPPSVLVAPRMAGSFVIQLG
jgi:hypothetical protein